MQSQDMSRTALVYKLQASDNAVLNLYAALQQHHSGIPLRSADAQLFEFLLIAAYNGIAVMQGPLLVSYKHAR